MKLTKKQKRNKKNAIRQGNRNSYQRRELKRRMYSNQNAICYICNKYMTFKDASVDHVIPLSKGGSSEEENLKLAHKDCNDKKGDLLIPFKI